MSFMANDSYIFLCKLMVKGANSFSDDDLDHFLMEYKRSPSAVYKNDQFHTTYNGIKQLLRIHSLYIDKPYGMLSGLICKIYCHDTSKLEDKIFEHLDNINLHLDEPINSTKIEALCNFGYLLSSHNSINPHMIGPCPANTMVMALSIFNDNLKKQSLDSGELIDMWISIWQMTPHSVIPNREIIATMVARQIQNLLFPLEGGADG